LRGCYEASTLLTQRPTKNNYKLYHIELDKDRITRGVAILLGMLFSATLWAHGGAAGTDTDQCKFELEPEHWIHYTAYQPTKFPAEELCGNLPDTDTY
jgi:hypothetical protein